MQPNTDVDYALLLEQAKKTACKMGQDPELLSIAGEAVLHAVRTFDPSFGVPIEAHVSLVTRTRIMTYWRMCAAQRTEYSDMLEPTCEDDEVTETHPDWRILVARYIDGQAEWSIARELGITTYEAHLRIQAAKTRFLQFMGAI